MGNCLNAASRQRPRGFLPEEESLSEIRRISQLLREAEEEEEAGAEYSEEPEVEAAPPATAEGLKVKIVLTRAELEWLMAQLKTGEQRLEDVLHHMQAVKAAAAAVPADIKHHGGAWRPRLESILECPEILIS